MPVFDVIRRMVAPRWSKLLLVGVALLLVGGAPLLMGLASAASNPPGNNGTIKVDREPFDDAPNNEPHVGCTFQVDFYGYDQGDLNADVTFTAHPPTGDEQVLLTDTVFIGQDDNSGGGSEAGLDASKTYTLDLTGIEPHPNQGVHVKLTIHAEGSQGADTKHKVFWVTGCETPPTTSTTVGQTTTTVGQTTTTTVGQTTTTTSGGPGPSTTVLETTTTGLGGVGGGSNVPPGQGGVMPFTGANSIPVAIAGLLLLLVGAAGVLASRRLRTR
jgi:hypothetical protein